MNVVSGGTPADRLARALAGAAVPEQFRRAFTSTPPDPRPGQLWRARRVDTSMLVLLTHVDSTAVDAVPVTMDDGYSTEDSVVLERDASPLGVSLTVWLELARTLPMRVLERYTADLELSVAATNPIDAVRAIGRPGRRAVSPPIPSWSTGPGPATTLPSWQRPQSHQDLASFRTSWPMPVCRQLNWLGS